MSSATFGSVHTSVTRTPQRVSRTVEASVAGDQAEVLALAGGGVESVWRAEHQVEAAGEGGA